MIQVVSAETALSVTVDIYDMRGERIRRFSMPGTGHELRYRAGTSQTTTVRR